MAFNLVPCYKSHQHDTYEIQSAVMSFGLVQGWLDALLSGTNEPT